MTMGSTIDGSVGLEALAGERQGPAVLGGGPDDVVGGAAGDLGLDFEGDSGPGADDAGEVGDDLLGDAAGVAAAPGEVVSEPGRDRNRGRPSRASNPRSIGRSSVSKPYRATVIEGDAKGPSRAGLDGSFWVTLAVHGRILFADLHPVDLIVRVLRSGSAVALHLIKLQQRMLRRPVGRDRTACLDRLTNSAN
jgi:hypothetical protein